jgi:hypothetical protein
MFNNRENALFLKKMFASSFDYGKQTTLQKQLIEVLPMMGKIKLCGIRKMMQCQQRAINFNSNSKDPIQLTLNPVSRHM